MGSTQAIEFATLVDERQVSLENALHYHLTGNHFPPIPAEMIPVAVIAIDNANADQWDDLIPLPLGVTWKGNTCVPTRAVISEMHLDYFLTPEYTEEDEEEEYGGI